MENISKLTPILYEKNETNFNHNGLGKLTKLLVNEIDEVLNGEFEALFEYPSNGRLADKIDNEMFIKAKPNKKDEPHIFKVYDYELDTFTQTYLIYARSKNIEDLKNNVILDVNVKNLAPTQAWNLAKNNALDPVVTTFYSDITTTSSVHWERRSLLSTIAGEEGSMIQYWGGEIKHGINRISLLRRRGQDNVTTVRHGKNLDGLKATYSTKGLVTAIVPYYVKGDDKSIYGDVVKSQYINNYPSTYYDIIEYNDEALGLSREDEPESGYSDSTIKTALNKAAKRYFDENIGKDLPSINMEISLEDISQTKEYEQFKDFEQIEIGDTITVYSKKFNVNINAKVRRVVYNGLTDKNELVEVGTARRSLYDDVRDEFKKVETELKEGIDDALTSANGKNTNYYGTADPNEIGLVGQNNDNYFRTNGQLKELWIYRDGMWHLEVGDLTGEQIRAEVEQAQQDIAEAQATADDTAQQIDTAVSSLGFIDLPSALSSFDGQLVAHQETLDGMQSIVYDPDRGIASLNTQLADLIQVAVTGEEMTGAISVLEDNLNLRLVAKDEVITQINASTEGILLQADKVQALGDVVVDGKLTITDEFIAPNAQIDGAKIADATIGSAKIIDLDVNQLVGNTQTFIQSNLEYVDVGKLTGNIKVFTQESFNAISDEKITIDFNGIQSRNGSNGEYARIQEGGLNFYRPDTSGVGRIGSYYDSSRVERGVSIGLYSGYGFRIEKVLTGGNRRLFEVSQNEYIRLRGDSVTIESPLITTTTTNLNNGRVVVGSSVTNHNQNLDLRDNILYGASRIEVGSNIRFASDSHRIYDNNRTSLNIAADTNLNLGTNNNGAINTVVRVVKAGLQMFGVLNMRGYTITRVGELNYDSDKRLKDILGERTEDDLATIMAINYKNYIMNGKKQRGFIAQELRLIDDELVTQNEDGYLGYEGQGYVHTIGHAVQQLALKEENTNKIASQALQATETNAQKIERLEKRIEELEGVA